MPLAFFVILALFVTSCRCQPGGQETDEGQQSASGLPAPWAAPVRLPGATQLMPIYLPPLPLPFKISYTSTKMFVNFRILVVLSPWDGTLTLAPSHPSSSREMLAAGAALGSAGPTTPCSGTRIWVERPQSAFSAQPEAYARRERLGFLSLLMNSRWCVVDFKFFLLG